MDSLECARKAKADADASLKISNDLVAAVEAKLQQLQDKFMEASSWAIAPPEGYLSSSSGWCRFSREVQGLTRCGMRRMSGRTIVQCPQGQLL